MTTDERDFPGRIPRGWRALQLDNLTSGAFRENTTVPYTFEGEVFHPGPNACWKNPDLLTEDLKKKRASNESFWLMGQPDDELRTVAKGEHEGKLEVEVPGFDYYNTKTGEIESGDTRRIALWMLDPDYDGRSLKAEIDTERLEAYRGTVSLPFEPGPHKRVAVKIVDDRGIESLKIISPP